MKKYFVIALLALVFIIPSVSFAAISDAGLLPDSSFYFFKSWKESIQLFFTFNAENKAKQYLHLAEVRLAEYQKMLEKGKDDIAEKTLTKYQNQLNRALLKAEEIKQKGKDIKSLSQQIEAATTKYLEVLQENLAKVPETAKKGIENAIENSQKGIERVLEVKIDKEEKEDIEAQKDNSSPCHITDDKRGCARIDFNIITPNGGERFCKGDTIDIKWKVPFDVDKVTLKLREAGINGKEYKIGVFHSYVNDTSYNENIIMDGDGDALWKIPSNISENMAYELWINAIYKGSSVNDVSDKVFSIMDCRG